jgi:hypothetical protein
MTIKPVDMQILVPRAGEVERINRTVQGQQQTDQQINQLIQEDIKQKEKIVNQMDAAKYKKVNDEGKEKDKENSKQEKDDGERKSQDSAEQQGTITGRHFDLKI